MNFYGHFIQKKLMYTLPIMSCEHFNLGSDYNANLNRSSCSVPSTADSRRLCSQSQFVNRDPTRTLCAISDEHLVADNTHVIVSVLAILHRQLKKEIVVDFRDGFVYLRHHIQKLDFLTVELKITSTYHANVF